MLKQVARNKVQKRIQQEKHFKKKHTLNTVRTKNTAADIPAGAIGNEVSSLQSYKLENR